MGAMPAARRRSIKIGSARSSVPIEKSNRKTVSREIDLSWAREDTALKTAAAPSAARIPPTVGCTPWAPALWSPTPTRPPVRSASTMPASCVKRPAEAPASQPKSCRVLYFGRHAAAVRWRGPDPGAGGRGPARGLAAAQPGIRQPRRLRAALARPGDPQPLSGKAAGRRRHLPPRGRGPDQLRAPWLAGERAGAHRRAATRAGRQPGGGGDQVGAARRRAASRGARDLPASGAVLRLDAGARRRGAPDRTGRTGRARGGHAPAPAAAGAGRAGADRDWQRRGRARGAAGPSRRAGGRGAAARQRAAARLRGRGPAAAGAPAGGGAARVPLP